MDFMACFYRLQYFDKEKALCEIMKNCPIVNLLCAVCFANFFAGCTSPYIGKNRQEIVEIIAKEQKKSPGKIYIYIPPGSNYHFDHPYEILGRNSWGGGSLDMAKFEKWGILPYKKFLVDGNYYTLLTFKNNIVIKEEEIYGGGYGFVPLTSLIFFIAGLFSP